MWDYILLALGCVIKVIYNTFSNYGVAIILFTVVIKLLLLPLNIKSQRAMKKQQKIQPIIAELQKKYANDQAKLQQEMMKVYKDNNVSMMGGCLPMFIQMPILVALYSVIRRPITFIRGAFFAGKMPSHISTTLNSLAEKVGETIQGGVDAFWKNDQIKISRWANEIGFEEWSINFDFLGLDLSRNPSEALKYLNDIGNNLAVVMLLLIPILAILSSIAQSKISMHLSGQDKNTNEQTQATNSMMMWMMPLMTGFFAFSLPAGMGLYWIASGAIQIVQQLVLNIYFEKKGEDFEIKVPEKKQYHGKKSKKR